VVIFIIQILGVMAVLAISFMILVNVLIPMLAPMPS
jgi:hypothetical protein